MCMTVKLNLGTSWRTCPSATSRKIAVHWKTASRTISSPFLFPRRAIIDATIATKLLIVIASMFCIVRLWYSCSISWDMAARIGSRSVQPAFCPCLFLRRFLESKRFAKKLISHYMYAFHKCLLLSLGLGHVCVLWEASRHNQVWLNTLCLFIRRYDCFGVINHIGTTEGGHYDAFVREWNKIVYTAPQGSSTGQGGPSGSLRSPSQDKQYKRTVNNRRRYSACCSLMA